MYKRTVKKKNFDKNVIKSWKRKIKKIGLYVIRNMWFLIEKGFYVVCIFVVEVGNIRFQ